MGIGEVFVTRKRNHPDLTVLNAMMGTVGALLITMLYAVPVRLTGLLKEDPDILKQLFVIALSARI